MRIKIRQQAQGLFSQLTIAYLSGKQPTSSEIHQLETVEVYEYSSY